jgi:hypothetical protein
MPKHIPTRMLMQLMHHKTCPSPGTRPPIMAPTTGSAPAPIITSPGTKAANRKAKKAVIIKAAHDLIKQRNASRSAYGILPKVLEQYKLFHTTCHQLQHAVRKIDSDSQLPSELFPSTVSCPDNLSLPVSKITKVSSGAIASQGIYHLGSDIHAKVVQQHAQKEATEANAVTKQAEKEEIQKGKAQPAWGKWRNGTRNNATISDLCILVQDLKEGSNSPLKKDRTGLVSQCKVREL